MQSASLLDISFHICKVQCISVQLFCTCRRYNIPSCSHRRSTNTCSWSWMLPQVWSNVVRTDHQSWSVPTCLEKVLESSMCQWNPFTGKVFAKSFFLALSALHCAGTGSVIHKYDKTLIKRHGWFRYYSGCMCQLQQYTKWALGKKNCMQLMQSSCHVRQTLV